MPRYFRPHEANALLPILHPLVREAMEIAERVQALQPELWAVIEKSVGNGGNPRLAQLVPDFERLHELLHQIQAMGVEVKDITVGLVDFPAWHEGRMVYLCWKYGESQVQFWHEVETGFAGRQPIDWD